jgi:hypothetical protein
MFQKSVENIEAGARLQALNFARKVDSVRTLICRVFIVFFNTPWPVAHNNFAT